MNEYLFILGNTPDLAKAEIEVVLKREGICSEKIFSSPKILHLKIEKEKKISDLIKILGGTVKIAQVKSLARNFKEAKRKILALIGKKQVVFGLSAYGKFELSDISYLNECLKEELRLGGVKSRYVLPQSGTVLSSVVVTKQKVQEINIVDEKVKFVLAETVAIQDFADWGKRDFGRPCPDPRKGMLPPKVARMMANISISNDKFQMSNQFQMTNFKLLDPFCGVGTILMEAMMVDASVLGSDISETMLNKTRKNLSWFRENYPQLKSDFRLLKSDATHISENLHGQSVDAIVSEGYLGPAKLPDDRKKIENIVNGLEKLYLGCLSDWKKILKPDGRLVLCLPEYRTSQSLFSVKKPIDNCEKLGYTLLAGPFEYARPQAVVVRKIYILGIRR